MTIPGTLGIAVIMGKELRSRMRGWRAIIVLTLYLAMLGGLGVAVLRLMATQLQYGGGSQLATFGYAMFVVLAGFQLLLVIFIAPALTAGAIAGERERQTLDLLLCTRLSAFAIVVGKLLASLSYTLLLLLASLPLFSLAFLFGGVSPRQLGLVFLVSLATAFTLGTISLFISSLLRRGQWATVLAYAAAFLLTFGTGVAALIVAAVTARGGVPQTPWITYFNPLAALASAVVPGTGSYGGFPFLFIGYYPQPPGTAGPVRPLWQYHLAIDAALIVVLLFASTMLVRPQGRRWPRLRRRE